MHALPKQIINLSEKPCPFDAALAIHITVEVTSDNCSGDY